METLLIVLAGIVVGVIAGSIAGLNIQMFYLLFLTSEVAQSHSVWSIALFIVCVEAVESAVSIVIECNDIDDLPDMLMAYIPAKAITLIVGIVLWTGGFNPVMDNAMSVLFAAAMWLAIVYQGMGVTYRRTGKVDLRNLYAIGIAGVAGWLCLSYVGMNVYTMLTGMIAIPMLLEKPGVQEDLDRTMTYGSVGAGVMSSWFWGLPTSACLTWMSGSKSSHIDQAISSAISGSLSLIFVFMGIGARSATSTSLSQLTDGIELGQGFALVVVSILLSVIVTVIIKELPMLGNVSKLNVKLVGILTTLLAVGVCVYADSWSNMLAAVIIGLLVNLYIKQTKAVTICNLSAVGMMPLVNLFK